MEAGDRHPTTGRRPSSSVADATGRPAVRPVVMALHRLLVIMVVGFLCAGALRGVDGPVYTDLASYLREAHGLALRSVPVATAGRRVFLASPFDAAGDSPTDVYVAEVAFGANGHVVAASGLRNLTHSRYGDEDALASEGSRVAFCTRIYGRVETLTVLDMRGDDSALVAGWSSSHRFMDAVTMWQEVGSMAGIDIRRFAFPAPVIDISLAWQEDGRLLIVADGAKIHLDPGDVTGAGVLRYFPRAKSERPFIHWAVDTVRNGGYLPEGTIDWAKSRFYVVAEHLDWLRYKVSNDDEALEAEAEAAAARVADASEFAGAAVEDWPPKPLTSELKGVPWHPPPHDWLLENPGAPEPFYVATSRPYKTRPSALYDVVQWDPGQVELRMVAGTREPMSATGYIGTGKVPRGPSILRLVATFNGGFQGDHGDYGMMVDRSTLLPAKDLSATIAVFTDGSLGLGSWPVGAPVPASMVSFRQNLSPLVAAGKINPHGRTWWGSSVLKDDLEDPTRTTRSGVCLTATGKMAYFFARRSNWREMAEIMVDASCEYGIHLDMNPGHTGGEFYRVYDEKAEKYDVERLTRNVSHMMYPRWIKTDARDFFYLTLRRVLPGPFASPELKWTAAGLPQAGMPPSFVLAEGPGDTLIVKVDLERASLSMKAGLGEPPPTTGAVVVDGGATAASVAVLHVSLGVSDADAPLGLMAERSLLFPPRAGLPTLGLTCGRRVGVAGKRTLCGPELAKWGAGIDLSAGLYDFKQGRALDSLAPAHLAFGFDPDGYFVIVASESGDASYVVAALEAAGLDHSGDAIANAVLIDLGGRKPAIWAETPDGARRFLLGEGKEAREVTLLRLVPVERPAARRIWPEVDEVPDKKRTKRKS